MSGLKDGGPAFPMATLSGAPPLFPGLSKLEWFAGQIMVGLLSMGGPPNMIVNGRSMPYDEAAVVLAKSLMERLAKETGG